MTEQAALRKGKRPEIVAPAKRFAHMRPMAIINGPGLQTRPISRKGRRKLSAAMLLLALVLGMGVGQALFHLNEPAIRRSEALGRLLCGEGMRVGRLWVGEDSSRIACFDDEGRAVADRGRALGLLIGLPFFLLFAVPTQWFAWKAQLRGRPV